MATSDNVRDEHTFDRYRLVMAPAIVRGSDGKKLGKVIDVAEDYILVQRGFFFPKEFVLPTWVIAREALDRVDLRVTAMEAEALGREHLPARDHPWFEPPSAESSAASGRSGRDTFPSGL
jgi:hypothetical protein